VVSYSSPGTHTITAAYAGDVDFMPSASGKQVVAVGTTGASDQTPPSSQLPTESQAPALLSVPNFPRSEPGHVGLDETTVTVRSHTVALPRLVCEGKESCEGVLTLSVHESARGKDGKRISRVVTVGSATFSIASGKVASVTIHLTAAGRALLIRDHGRLEANLRIVENAPRSTVIKKVHLVEAKA
jgi:hypothetical protein